MLYVARVLRWMTAVSLVLKQKSTLWTSCCHQRCWWFNPCVAPNYSTCFINVDVIIHVVDGGQDRLTDGGCFAFELLPQRRPLLRACPQPDCLPRVSRIFVAVTGWLHVARRYGSGMHLGCSPLPSSTLSNWRCADDGVCLTVVGKVPALSLSVT